MSRVRKGLRMASPGESKWCSIMVNPAPDQAGDRVEEVPYPGGVSWGGDDPLREEHQKQESRLTLKHLPQIKQWGWKNGPHFLDVRLEGVQESWEEKK